MNYLMEQVNALGIIILNDCINLGLDGCEMERILSNSLCSGRRIRRLPSSRCRPTPNTPKLGKSVTDVHTIMNAPMPTYVIAIARLEIGDRPNQFKVSRFL